MSCILLVPRPRHVIFLSHLLFFNLYDINTIIFPPQILDGKVVPLLTELVNSPEWTLAVALNRELLFFRNEAFPDLPIQYKLDKRSVWPLVIDEARRLIAHIPDYAIAYVALGEAFLELGDHQQAIAAFRNYLLLEPGDEKIAVRVAELESQWR